MGDAEILIIEDSPTQAAQLRHILEKHSYRVSIADNGKKALDEIAVQRPDLIISDIVMPEMDGYEVCRRIKANKELRDIPVLLLTVLSDPRDVIMGLECGADYFIIKPCVEEHLLTCISRMQTDHIQLARENSTGGLELHFDGQYYVINADRRQILNLLLSTYETAIHKNRELIQARKELQQSEELFKELSITDHLTQLYNRRFLMDTLEREFERIRRNGGSLSLIIIDIDYFKMINDTYGHQFGDKVLTAIAKVVKTGLRCYDVAARYGGDEFVLALPETSLSEAKVVAEHLRAAVQAMSFSPRMETFAVSISLGAAVFPSPLIDSIDLLLRQADEALYLAKQKGRNRVDVIMQ